MQNVKQFLIVEFALRSDVRERALADNVCKVQKSLFFFFFFFFFTFYCFAQTQETIPHKIVIRCGILCLRNIPFILLQRTVVRSRRGFILCREVDNRFQYLTYIFRLRSRSYRDIRTLTTKKISHRFRRINKYLLF